MIVYLYRWKLKPDKISQFVEAWSQITEALRTNCGSLGSRLHIGDDGLYYGYAQWPSKEHREKSMLNTQDIQNARMLMQDAIEESFPDIRLDPLSDHLAWSGLNT